MNILQKNIAKKKNKKLLFISVLVIVILIIVYGVLVLTYSLWPLQKRAIQSSNPSNSLELNTTSKTKTQNPDVNQTTTNQVPVNQGLSATITELTSNSDAVIFKAIVTGSSENGTCVISFTNPNDKPVTRTFDGVLSDNNVSCGEVSVPSSEFSYIGQWHVTFRYYVNNTQVTAEKDVDIKQ